MSPSSFGDDTLHKETVHPRSPGRERNHVYAVAPEPAARPTDDLRRALAVSTAKQTAHDRGGLDAMTRRARPVDSRNFGDLDERQHRRCSTPERSCRGRAPAVARRSTYSASAPIIDPDQRNRSAFRKAELAVAPMGELGACLERLLLRLGSRGVGLRWRPCPAVAGIHPLRKRLGSTPHGHSWSRSSTEA